MLQDAIQHHGQLVDILSQIADVEFQLVRQGVQPTSFVPTDLLEEWYIVFNTGMRHISMLDEEMVAALLDFDMLVEQVIDIMPHQPADKEEFIRFDQLWQEIRDMADWTLMRLAFLMMPAEVDHHYN
jgi:hypothetical protein